MNDLIKTPKTQRGYQTLNAICESARQLFYKKGYYNTSINDIASGANVAPGTFYIYFNDKLSLYKYLLLQFSHEIRLATRCATSQCKTRYEMEYHGLKAFLEYVREKPYAYHIIWESLYIDPTLFKEYYESFSERYVRGLEEARKNNEIVDLDLTVTSYVLMGISNFVGLRYSIFNKDEDLEEVVKTVMKIIDRGLFVKKNMPDEK